MSEIGKIVMLKDEFVGRKWKIVDTDGFDTYRLKLIDAPEAPSLIRSSSSILWVS